MVAGKRGEKALNFGTRLKYPIRITRLYKQPGDTIRRQEPVLQYAFEYTMELPHDRETLALQTKTLTSITDWNAPEDGKLLAWNVRVGDVVARDGPCVTVEEACTHEVQYQGLCALCGKDMNEVNWASEQRDTERAPINMTHDQTSLTVSHLAATRAENELQSRLLNQRKLSLVVDLDQTIIHACIDPTIGEWQQDPSNPNYEALQDVRRFQLDEGFRGLARGCWYYIKMRPGLTAFLAKIATMYELHVYTMGTRTYATNVAHIVDPDQKLFGNRVISRDENGNIVAKSLQRLFPVSTNMAVIMDDRADVWPYNRQNLIKVTPYDFFKGTGDINSSFLPKRSDLSVASSSSSSSSSSSPSSSATAAATPGGDSSTVVVTDENTVSASPASTAATAAVSVSPAGATTAPTNGDSQQGSSVPNGVAKVLTAEEEAEAVMLQKQAEEQERTIEQQIKERPLLHMQEQLDKADEEAAAAAAEPEGSTSAATPDQGAELGKAEVSKASSRPRHCVLSDDDTELQFLEQHLTRLHAAFYEEYDAKRRRTAASQDNSSSGSNKREDDRVAAVPDVGTVLTKLKTDVLKGTTIVLSGLVPLGMDVARSEIGLQVVSFGAKLQRQITKKTTHLVISSDRPRTQKVRQAARIPTTKIVNQHWLADCFSQWARVDETPYLVSIHPEDRERPTAGGSFPTETDTETISDAESESVNGGLKITISQPSGDRGEEDDDDDDEDDDEFRDFNNSDAVSPIAELGAFDWGSADDELEMFLAEGGDDDDDDEEDDEEGDENEDGEYGEEEPEATDDDDDGANGDDTEGNTASFLSSASKRKHTGGDDTDTDGGRASLRGRHLLAKRQKRAGVSRSRSTSRLRAATTAAPGSHDGHPLKQQTNQEANQTASSSSGGGGGGGGQESSSLAKPAAAPPPANVDIDEDQLEAMLMAELDEDEAEGRNG